VTARGPTWDELRAWCAYQGQNFDRLKEWMTRHRAEAEVKRTLDEMTRLAEVRPKTAAEWREHSKAWDANERAHERALNIAYPRDNAGAKP
jgi:hypothetical protein